MKKTFILFGLAVLIVPVFGEIIDFDDLTGTGETLRTAPYIENGFILTTNWENNGTLVGNEKFSSVHNDSQFYAGSVSFITNYTDDFPILIRQGGGTFDLISIDLDSLWLGNANVEFIGVLEGGGTVTQSFVTDSTRNSMQTFTFSGFNDLVSVSWDDLEFATLHHFDNIVANIPEPASIAFLALGVMLAGRKRRKF